MSLSEPIQLVFIKKLLTPCLKLERLDANLTSILNGWEFHMSIYMYNTCMIKKPYLKA